MEVQKLLADPNVPIAKIEATLLRDPALAAQVLRMANSAMYAGLNAVTTLRQALTRVGVQQISRLVLAAAQVSLYQSRHPLFKKHIAELWKAAFASAIGCAWVAHKSSHGELAEQAFVAGLLHDVGKLVILRSIEKLIAEKGIEGPLPDSMAMEMIDALHCEFGHDLMQRWNLPEVYACIGRDHHLSETDNGNVLMVIVRLVDQITRKMGIGCPAEPSLEPAASEEACALMLSEVAIADLEVTLEDKLGLNVMPQA